MPEQIAWNSKNVTLYFVLSDLNTGERITGLTATTAACSYTRERSARVHIADASIAVTDPWVSGGFCEVNASGSPGLYRLDVPNEAFVHGVSKVEVTVYGPNVLAETKEIELVPPGTTSGTVGATVDVQPTYTSYGMVDGTVRTDHK